MFPDFPSAVAALRHVGLDAAACDFDIVEGAADIMVRQGYPASLNSIYCLDRI